MSKRREQSFIQELVSQPPVEAFDKSVLDRLARRNVMPVNFGPVRPLQDRVAGELAAVVADDHPRLAALLDNPVKLPCDAKTGKRCIGGERQALPRAIIDDGQNPQPAPIGEASLPRPHIECPSGWTCRFVLSAMSASAVRNADGAFPAPVI